MNYFRVTIYDKTNNLSAILDSNGAFKKLWQFSAYLVSKELNIIDACKIENIIDTNIKPTGEDTEHIILRATQGGKVEPKDYVIKVADKFYITNNL